MMAQIMKEKTSRGLSSLDESVRVLLKYICGHITHLFSIILVLLQYLGLVEFVFGFYVLLLFAFFIPYCKLIF